MPKAKARKQRKRVAVCSETFAEILTRDKVKNGPLGGNRGLTEDWRNYIEVGYDPMEADWCLAELVERGVRFGLDDQGQFAYDENRLILTPGHRASIDYRRRELTRILTEVGSPLRWDHEKEFPEDEQI